MFWNISYFFCIFVKVIDNHIVIWSFAQFEWKNEYYGLTCKVPWISTL